MTTTIAVTGKGGTGKTLTSGLIINYLKRNAAGAILAIDADPDANLATILGIEVEQTIGDLREETLRNIKDLPQGMSKTAYIEAGLHQIIVETQKLDLITMGRSEGPSCYCYINSILRKFAEDVHGTYEWVVMDNEAGLEHLSRRTAARADRLITVISDNPFSVDCAGRIDALVKDLKTDIGKKYFVVNAVSDDKFDVVMGKMESIDMEYLGRIPYDPDLEERIFKGESLLALASGPALESMNEIMQKLGG